ncbi:TPA: MFS transporter [Vibrio parahaemolyticus]|uniref:MFS transporter n=1 Tax=Vibrio parahaemolyticus TaxID=670 RepID=UPI001A90A5A1|nr:MFS transporter [Vibrio parahaemolyticus]MBO0156011.1 MFS transporter [Vibrio parahaemolyticus]MBO0171586.1 MFS transporter [Vibrio parahaemolyticus]MCX8857420.1 MFS transporter [Vibrio parahaemolyticus]MCX8861227.1 MFS transporter [Vibrio parahaemolyticus]MCX8867943.1 MFS transporter [Vibrio parahaemolyticus]
MIYLFLFFESLLSLSSVVSSFYFSIKIFDDTESAAVMAASVFVTIAPSIYLSFISGKVADKVGKLRLIKICSFVYFLVFSLFFLYVDHYQYTTTAIFIFIFIKSLISSFNTISVLTIIPEQVSKDKTRIALGLQGFLNKGVLIVGPIIAGSIYSHIEVDTIILCSMLCCPLIFLTSFHLKRNDKKLRNVKNKETFISCGKEIAQKPRLLTSLCFFTLFNVVNGISSAFLVAYAFMVFGNLDYTLSVYNLFMAIGALVGTLYSIKKLHLDPLLVIGISTILCAFLGRISIGFTSDLFVFSSLLAIRAACIPIGNMSNQILWIEGTESNNRGKMFGFRRLIAQGFYPISVLLCSILVHVSNLDSNISFLKSMFIFTGVFEVVISMGLVSYCISNRNTKKILFDR